MKADARDAAGARGVVGRGRPRRLEELGRVGLCARRLRPAWLAAFMTLTAAPVLAEETESNLAGSIQVDHLVVLTTDPGRRITLDGTTVELSVKLALDLSDRVSANVKVCFACHGFELGTASFDASIADELNVRAGRFTPSFGDYPARHDPANHRTSDNPLPYDMGRMLRIRELNLGVLPAPWVDNGVELHGRHYFAAGHQVDYALYAVMGPKGPPDAVDLDFTQSRSAAIYYADNNSRPTLGARLAGTLKLARSTSLSLGASAMGGSYDPEQRLDFVLLGADLVLRADQVFLRAEYLIRRTDMALGPAPATRFKYGPGSDGTFDAFFVKEGFYTELEVPAGRVDLVARWDGLRRRGNVLATSSLRSRSTVLRYTGALALRLSGALRLKVSGEYYDFSDFSEEVAVHVGFAGPF